ATAPRCKGHTVAGRMIGVRPGATSSPRAGRGAPTMPDQARVRMLIVDDDDEYRGLIARRFGRRGHDVEQTGSPAQALRLVEKTHFDVAILDIAMPEMDGVQLLERLRQIDPETQVI